MALQNWRLPKASLTQLAITGVVAVAFGLFVGVTAFYHFRSYDQAFSKYIHDRTAENKAALNVEGGKIQHLRNVLSFKTALLSFFVLNAGYSLFRRKGRLAAVGLLAASSTILAYVGIPSFPIDWRCCAFWGPGFDDGVSQAAVQITAICVWIATTALLVFSFVYHRRQNVRS